MPTSAARDMNFSMSSTENSSQRGLTTFTRLYPFWGRIKRDFGNFFARAEAGHVVLVVYAAALMAIAVAVAASLIGDGYGIGSWVVVALLALAAMVAERSTVRLTASLEVSVTLLPTLLAAVVFGPLAAMAVCAASMTVDFRRPYTKWAVYTASRSITGAVAGCVATYAAVSFNDRLTGVAVATIAGMFTIKMLDGIFVATTLKLRRRNGFWESIKTVAAVEVAALPLQAPVVAVLSFAYVAISPWTLPLFLVPAMAAHRFFGLYQEERVATNALAEVNERLEAANLSFATALVATLDARDRYTAGHSAAVAVYARDIAARMGLSVEEQRVAHLCGLVHDIGKVGLPPGLLEKPGPLTLDERRQMEQHAEIGERILAKVEDYSDIALIVRHHHERIDGQGYPDGLGESDIPLISRIIAVADAYDAMISDRPYRDAMPTRVARLRLAQAVASQFDTSVVAAFEAILAGATDEYRQGLQPDFHFETQEEVVRPSLAAAVG
jgi:putative nucleotidyltransferase with HDIG domain